MPVEEEDIATHGVLSKIVCYTNKSNTTYNTNSTSIIPQSISNHCVPHSLIKHTYPSLDDVHMIR